MSVPTAASNALLSEHFGFTPLTLIDDIINTVNELLYMSVASVEKFFTSVAPEELGFRSAPGTFRDTDDNGKTLLTDAEDDEIQKGIHQLETLLEAAIDRNFDGFELFVLRNILVVKPELVAWVRLAHHKGLDFEVVEPSAQEGTDSNAPPILVAEDHVRLRNLRQTFRARRTMNIKLQVENTLYDRTLEQLRTAFADTTRPPTTIPEGEITSFTLLSGSKDARDKAAFAASQLALIRKLVDELKVQYDLVLAERRRAEESREKGGPLIEVGSEAERTQYIEKITRKYLENSRGLRLNARGEVIGGDFDSTIRKGPEEVQRLEEIAGKLGKEGDSKAKD